MLRARHHLRTPDVSRERSEHVREPMVESGKVTLRPALGRRAFGQTLLTAAIQTPVQRILGLFDGQNGALVDGARWGQSGLILTSVPSNLVPNVDNTYNIGTPSLRWTSVNAYNFAATNGFSGPAFEATTGFTLTGVAALTASGFIPSADNTTPLGSASFAWSNLFLGPNRAPVLDTTSGNIGYYKQTRAESAASVTPTNFVYQPGIAIDPRRYGMKADGVTNDYRALNNALLVAAQSGGFVQLPAGQILIGQAVMVPSNVAIIGCGAQRTKLLRGFAGDFITSFGSYASLQNLTIDGQQGTWGTGNGVVLAAAPSNNQFFLNCEVTNFQLACLKITPDAGRNMCVVGGAFFTTGTTGSQGAIQCTGTDSAAGSRCFVNVESGGCTLFDFGGANDTFVTGGFSNGWLFGPNSSKVCIANSRIGTTGSFTTLTINGTAHQIINVPSAAPIVVNGSGHVIHAQPNDWAITDNSTGSDIFIKQNGYTPSWTGSTTNPSLGNGTIYAVWSRTGNHVTVDIQLLIGSTTTFGSGNWQFSLPVRPYNPGNGNGHTCGSSLLQHSGTFNAAVSVNNPAESFLTLIPHGATGPVSPRIPWTWAKGDHLYIHHEFQVR
jgi:hypothetical protein